MLVKYVEEVFVKFGKYAISERMNYRFVFAGFG